MLKVSQDCIDLVKQFEGRQLQGYICPAGVPTIGYGYTGKINGQTITTKTIITAGQAEELLAADLERFASHVRKFDSKYHWTQNEFDALVSFAYNVGSINQLTQNKKRTKAQIASAMLLYNKANGKILAGLTRRRKAEQALFLQSNGKDEDTVALEMKVVKSGSKGNTVKAVQILLNGLGYPCGNADGVFGNRTLSAVKKFQQKHNLVIDGIVDQKTFEKLLK